MAKAQTKPEEAGAEENGSNRERRKELLEREILDKACTLFAEKGFGGTSLTDIADAVGLTRAAVYYYFKNKEALLEAIVNDVSATPLRESIEWRQSAPEGAADRLHSFVRMRLKSVLTRQVQMKMIGVTEASLPEDLAQKHNNSKRQILREYRDIIRHGIKTGEFRPVDDRIAALAIIGMGTWSVQWYNPDRGPSADEVADQIADLAVHSVAVERGMQDRFSSPETAIQTLREDIEHLAKLL